jgi:hypothetical protein
MTFTTSSLGLGLGGDLSGHVVLERCYLCAGRAFKYPVNYEKDGI